MANKLDEIFHPEIKWQDKKLTSMNPCDSCDTYKEYEMRALYGNIAERQYTELPKNCETCIPKINWQIDCMTKLRWYEDNDERLKKRSN